MEDPAGFEDLPTALHRHILSFLPLVDRVRSALEARSWATLLDDPAFWTELRFDGAPNGAIDKETLQDLCRRAGGRLRTLDVTGPGCDTLAVSSVCAALASEGLGTTLESLSVNWITFDAEALIAVCPALTAVSASMCGAADACLAVLRVLPRAGKKQVILSMKEIPLPGHAAAGERAAAARRALLQMWNP